MWLPDDDNLQTGQYKAIAEFTDAKGCARYTKTKSHVRTIEEFKGKEFTVIYDPQDPNTSMFEIEYKKKISILPTALMSALIAAGIFFFAAGFFQ